MKTGYMLSEKNRNTAIIIQGKISKSASLICLAFISRNALSAEVENLRYFGEYPRKTSLKFASRIIKLSLERVRILKERKLPPKVMKNVTSRHLTNLIISELIPNQPAPTTNMKQS